MPATNAMSIPITLHTRPSGAGRSSSSSTTTRFMNPISNAAAGTKYLGWSISKPRASSSSTSTSASSSTKTSTRLATTVKPLADETGKRKRKFTAVNVNDLDPSMFFTLTPSTTTIIQRCYPPPRVAMPVAAPASGAGGKKKGSSLSREIKVATTSRWSRATDFGNSRSNVPSPQEVVREKIRAQQRAEAKALAVKKGKKPAVSKAMAKRRFSNNASGSDTATAEPRTSANTSTAPVSNFAPRTALKRTRSTGVPPISTTIANALGTGTVSVSSPLKVVTGPNTLDEAEVPGRKRSRLSNSDNSKKPAAGSIRKANSLSPNLPTIPIPAIGGAAAATSAAGPASKPVSTGRGKGLPAKAMEGGLEMRRVVSASNIGRKQAAAPEMARERSKREVTLPGRLRDYDIKAGALW